MLPGTMSTLLIPILDIRHLMDMFGRVVGVVDIGGASESSRRLRTSNAEVEDWPRKSQLILRASIAKLEMVLLSIRQ